MIGTLLNVINQGPEILSSHTQVWWKLLLTYFVPFAVASYGTYDALAGPNVGEECNYRK